MTTIRRFEFECRCLALLLLAVTLLSRSAFAENPVLVVSAEQTANAYEEGANAARDFSKLTGVALTPLLGMSVVGALAWWTAPAEERPRLPFQQRPWFWGVGLVIVAFLWLGHRLPVIKKGFKLFKLWENKVSAALAIPLIGSQLVPALLKPAGIVVSIVSTFGIGSASAQVASENIARSDATQGAIYGVAWVAATAVGGLVWLAGHTVNVLTMVSPVWVVDWILKGSKAVFIGTLVFANWISPWAGLFVAVLYVIVAALVAGWSMRLMVFGWVFSSDLLLFRSRRHRIEPHTLWAFSGSAMTEVPLRTYGRLVVQNGTVRFEYRPWLVLARRSIELFDQKLSVERGLISPTLIGNATEGWETLARFPPRFRPFSEALAATLGGLPVRDAALVRGFRAGKQWVVDQFRRVRRHPRQEAA